MGKVFNKGTILVVSLFVFITFLLASSASAVEVSFKATKPKLVWESVWGGDHVSTSAIWLSNNGDIQLSGQRMFDGFILEYNSSGDFKWNTSWNSGSNSGIYDINNYYAIGSDSTSAYLISYNPTGDINWSKELGVGYYAGGILLSNNSLYFSGGIEIASLEYKTIIAKYDLNGSEIWNKTWHEGARDVLSSLCVDKNNSNLYTTGITCYPSVTSPSDVLVLKYNITGKPDWNKTWGTSSIEDNVQDCEVDNNNSIYTCGWTKTGDQQTLILKYDQAGNLIWSRTWKNNSNAYATGLAVDNNNSIYICGLDGSSSLLIKYDSSGSVIWDTSWKNSSMTMARARDVAVTPNGEIYVAGQMGIGCDCNYSFLLKYIEIPNAPEFPFILISMVATIAIFILITKRKKVK